MEQTSVYSPTSTFLYPHTTANTPLVSTTDIRIPPEEPSLTQSLKWDPETQFWLAEVIVGMIMYNLAVDSGSRAL